MANPPLEYLRDRTRLSDWMSRNPNVPIEARNDDLQGIDLSNLELQKADLRGANLKAANFQESDLSQARLDDAKLPGANLDRVKLVGAVLNNCLLEGATLRKANVRSATCSGIRLIGAVAEACDFEGSNLEGAYFERANLKGANLSHANLMGANFLRCDLRDGNLSSATLTNTAWRGAWISSNTSFRATAWHAQHDSPNDGAEEVKLDTVRRVLNWENIRLVGRLPLFSGSYLLLTASLAVTTAINWLNDSQVLQTLSYPVPMLPRVILLLFGSTLLAVGATIFEISCPPKVKEFPRVRWIEELRRPGILYLSESLQKPIRAALASAFVTFGGFLVGYVFVERVYRALTIAIEAVR